MSTRPSFHSNYSHASILHAMTVLSIRLNNLIHEYTMQSRDTFIYLHVFHYYLTTKSSKLPMSKRLDRSSYRGFF